MITVYHTNALRNVLCTKLASPKSNILIFYFLKFVFLIFDKNAMLNLFVR